MGAWGTAADSTRLNKFPGSAIPTTSIWERHLPAHGVPLPVGHPLRRTGRTDRAYRIAVPTSSLSNQSKKRCTSSPRNREPCVETTGFSLGRLDRSPPLKKRS